jgi:hypothetical protein
VLPPTWSESEWRRAGQLLGKAMPQYRFRELLVEFGNENWNAIFRPAGISDPQTLSFVASRAFAALAEGTAADPRIRPVVGGQFYNPGQVETLRQTIPQKSILAVAPYWAFELDTTADLFPDSLTPVLRQMKDRHPTAIYEMNAHSLGGNLSLADRNHVLESNDTGAAMIWNTLGALSAGVRQICVYSFAGFDTPADQPGQLVRLFGITRDLAQANQFRPAGKALVELNDVASGDLYASRSSSSKIRLVAIRNKIGWTIVAASRSSQPETVLVHLPGRSVGLVEVQVPAFGFSIAKKELKSNDR